MNRQLILIILMITLIVGLVIAVPFDAKIMEPFDKEKIENYLSDKTTKKVKAIRINKEYISSHAIYDIELDDVPYKFIPNNANYNNIVK